MFKTDTDRAVAYAAFKTLERMLKNDGELPPGFCLDVSGANLNITLPQGTVVERDKGSNGDGTMYKKATTKLFGYAMWALMLVRLDRFKHGNQVREIMVDAAKAVLASPSKDVKGWVTKKFPDVAKEMEKLQQSLPLGEVCEPTPRLCSEAKLPATIVVRTKKAA